jgi:hypothetical protein
MVNQGWPKTCDKTKTCKVKRMKCTIRDWIWGINVETRARIEWIMMIRTLSGKWPKPQRIRIKKKIVIAISFLLIHVEIFGLQCDLIWFRSDPIRFDLIWFDLIWFDSCRNHFLPQKSDLISVISLDASGIWYDDYLITYASYRILQMIYVELNWIELKSRNETNAMDEGRKPWNRHGKYLFQQFVVSDITNCHIQRQEK